MASSLSQYKDMSKSFLGGAFAVRSNNKYLAQINTMTIGLAIVLSIMVINTHNKCNDDADFKKDSIVYFEYVVAILVLVAFLVILLLDLGAKFKLF